jgi:hypothetical protein
MNFTFIEKQRNKIALCRKCHLMTNHKLSSETAEYKK